MQLARVIGTVVATRKNALLEGAKLLLVQPHAGDQHATPYGSPFLAIDAVQAGVGETVLVVIEGRAAGSAIGRKRAPVDAAIIGIVDDLESDGPSPSPRRAGRAAR